MTRRFVLLVDDATQEQQNILTRHFLRQGIPFWHYFSDAWLLVDPADRASTVSLRETLRRLLPESRTVILRVDNPNAWAAYGSQEAVNWFHGGWQAQYPEAP